MGRVEDQVLARDDADATPLHLCRRDRACASRILDALRDAYVPNGGAVQQRQLAQSQPGAEYDDVPTAPAARAEQLLPPELPIDLARCSVCNTALRRGGGLCRHRYHCRYCGVLVCAECSLARAHLRGFVGAQRVCKRCIPVLRSVQNTFRPSNCFDVKHAASVGYDPARLLCVHMAEALKRQLSICNLDDRPIELP